MWYYVRNNQRIGPVDENTIISLIQNGTVVRQTLVWKEGMQDWLRADASELTDKFAVVAPVPPGGSLTTYAPAATLYDPNSLRKLWIWYTCLASFGTIFLLLFIGIPALIAAAVINYILLYRFWSLIQDGKARTSPGVAVGFCFIPFFNLYWFYIAYIGLAKDMNLYIKERSISCPGINEGLALAWYILTLVSIIPYAVFITGIPLLVIQIILLKQWVDASKEIILTKSKNQNTQTP